MATLPSRAQRYENKISAAARTRTFDPYSNDIEARDSDSSPSPFPSPSGSLKPPRSSPSPFPSPGPSNDPPLGPSADPPAGSYAGVYLTIEQIRNFSREFPLPAPVAYFLYTTAIVVQGTVDKLVTSRYDPPGTHVFSGKVLRVRPGPFTGQKLHRVLHYLRFGSQPIRIVDAAGMLTIEHHPRKCVRDQRRPERYRPEQPSGVDVIPGDRRQVIVQGDLQFTDNQMRWLAWSQFFLQILSRIFVTFVRRWFTMSGFLPIWHFELNTRLCMRIFGLSTLNHCIPSIGMHWTTALLGTFIQLFAARFLSAGDGELRTCLIAKFPLWSWILLDLFIHFRIANGVFSAGEFWDLFGLGLDPAAIAMKLFYSWFIAYRDLELRKGLNVNYPNKDVFMDYFPFNILGIGRLQPQVEWHTLRFKTAIVTHTETLSMEKVFLTTTLTLTLPPVTLIESKTVPTTITKHTEKPGENLVVLTPEEIASYNSLTSTDSIAVAQLQANHRANKEATTNSIISTQPETGSISTRKSWFNRNTSKTTWDWTSFWEFYHGATHIQNWYNIRAASKATETSSSSWHAANPPNKDSQGSLRGCSAAKQTTSIPALDPTSKMFSWTPFVDALQALHLFKERGNWLELRAAQSSTSAAAASASEARESAASEAARNGGVK